MNAKPKSAKPDINAGVLFRLPIQQRKAIVRNLHTANYFDDVDGRPNFRMAYTSDVGWNDIVDEIMSGKIDEQFWIKELMPRQVAELYAVDTLAFSPGEWSPADIKRAIRKQSKPLYDAWHEIKSIEKKAAIRSKNLTDAEWIDEVDAQTPDKTQRDFMRELFMKFVDAEPTSEWIPGETVPVISEEQENQIIKEYVKGERDGVVVRRSRKKGVTPAQYARNLLNDGLDKGWIYDFMAIPKESDEVIKRVRTAIEKSGLTVQQVASRCGVSDKNVYNWQRTGQIARQFLLPFARVTSTDAHPVTVDWILGGADTDRTKEDPTGKQVDPVWFSRPALNTERKMITETTRLMPVLSQAQVMSWHAGTQDFWTNNPEEFPAVSATDIDWTGPSTPTFATVMDTSAYGPDIVEHDMVYWADGVLPHVGDFCTFKVWKPPQGVYEVHAEPQAESTNPRLVMGYFYPIGGRPDNTNPANYWKSFQGITLTENKDGSPSRYDFEYQESDGWKYELVAVASEIHRPLVESRRPVLAPGGHATEQDAIDSFFKSYSPDEIAEMIKDSDEHQQIMEKLEEHWADVGADWAAEEMMNRERGK